jgi:Tol biopolymer transport system component
MGFLERASHEPVQLTHGPMTAYWPLPSLDGKRIFFQGYQARNEFLRYDLRSRRYEPELPGVSGAYLEFSRDRKRVVYIDTHGEPMFGSLFAAAADGSERLQLTSPPLQACLPRWSPNGQEIAFIGRSGNGPTRIYVVAVDGSGLRQVTHGESGNKGDFDPSWSPDGASIVFGGAQGDSPGQEFIRVIDLKSNHVSVFPGSQGMWSPRLSQDGRMIAGLSEERTLFAPGSGRLMLYDPQTQKQSQLFGQRSGWLSWSLDGEYLFFKSAFKPRVDGFSEEWAWRVRIRDRKVEPVSNLQQMRVTGWGWFAAAPNNSFVTAVDASIQEIFALDWKAR